MRPVTAIINSCNATQINHLLQFQNVKSERCSRPEPVTTGEETLEGRRVVPDEARIIRVTYLHVTINKINISG